MRAIGIPLLALPALAALFAPPAASLSSGIYLGGITRSAPACGQCHRASPGAPAGFTPIALEVVPGARVLAAGQATSLTVTARGGQSASTRGGFAMDTSAGTFSAGPNTRLHAGGTAIGHATPSSRTWSFGFTAPAAPGLVELYAVTNTVDADGRNDNDDFWAFHGADQTATASTPVRLFANADGVTALGTSCAGSFGNVPVLGSREVPALGNAAFDLELHGAAPSSQAVVLIGTQEFHPGIDLGFLGAPGCTLMVNPVVTLATATSAGNAMRGEGSAMVPLPVPARPVALRGRSIAVQMVVIDLGNGRALPITTSNGLRVTFQ